MKAIIEKIESQGSFLYVSVSLIQMDINCEVEKLVIPLHYNNSFGDWIDIIEWTVEEIHSLILNEINSHLLKSGKTVGESDILWLNLNMFSPKEVTQVKEATKKAALSDPSSIISK